MYIIHGQKLVFNYKEIKVIDDCILPTISLIFNRSSRPMTDVQVEEFIVINNAIAEVYIKRENSVSYFRIGNIPSKKLLYEWDKNGESELEFYFMLDDYILSEIERI